MTRVLKSLIPERGGTVMLPVCAKPVSVGFQRERRSAPIVGVPSVDPSWPVDQVDPGHDPSDLARFVVRMTDMRTGTQVQHVAVAPLGFDEVDADGVFNEAASYYGSRGYCDFQVTPCAPSAPDDHGIAPPAANLVPVLWWEEPCLDSVDGDAEGMEFVGVDENDYASRWPKACVELFVVPTGEPAPRNAVFMGTLQRPQRQDPSRDAVFHIYILRTSLLRFA